MYCRVMEEIEEVVGDKTTVEADDLDKLTYMNQVFEESMRLFPAASPQKLTPSGGITLKGYYLPEGLPILVRILSFFLYIFCLFQLFSFCTHRCPEYFDDPLKFDPSRFDPGQKR